MIGNNDWLDYMEYRDYIAHSMGMWDKSKVKYKDKIPVGGGKFRYIYDEPKNPRGNRGRMQPRTVQQQRTMGRSGGMQRVSTNSRQASRPVSFRDRDTGNTKPRNLFDHMGNALGNAAKAAGNWMGDRARDVQNAASGAWNRATGGDGRLDREDLSRAANAAGRMAGNAANAANAAGRMAGNAVNAAGRMAEKWTMDNIAPTAGQFIGDRARDIGEVANAAGKFIGDRMNDIGEATGINARNRLENAKAHEKWTRQTRDDARKEFQEVYDKNNGNLGKYGDHGLRGLYTDAARDHGAAQKGLREAQNAYDNSLLGRAENAANAAGRGIGNMFNAAGNWLGNAADAVGDWVGDRAADARDAVSDMVDQAGRSLGSAYDRMSGREDGSTWNRVTGGDGHFNYEDVGNAVNAAGRRAQNVGNWIGDRAREVQGAASNVWDAATAGDGRFDLEDADRIAGNVANRVGNAARSAGQWMGDRAADFRDNVSGAVDALGARAGSAYDRMRGREDGETWNNITGGDNHFNYGDVQNVANAAGRRARNLYDQAGNAIGGVGDWIGDRVNDAGYQLAERASELGGALRDGRDFINNATGITARNNLEAARNQEAQTRDTRDLARIAYRNTPNDGYQSRYTDAAQAHGAAQRDLREAQNAYNNTPLGRAENLARGVGEAASNVSSAARNLIETAGGNIAQALNWAQQRLRYAQNTGNPQMERDAEAIMRELENLPQQRL